MSEHFDAAVEALADKVRERLDSMGTACTREEELSDAEEYVREVFPFFRGWLADEVSRNLPEALAAAMARGGGILGAAEVSAITRKLMLDTGSVIK